MQKAVNTKTKAGLRSSIIIQDVDSHSFRNHYLSQNIFTKMQTQSLIAKKFKSKEFRPKNSNLADKKTLVLPCTNESKKTFY